MEPLIETYTNRLEQTNNDFVRYLMPQINWNNRLFAVIGARGTGKTTLLLQLAENFIKTIEKLIFSK